MIQTFISELWVIAKKKLRFPSRAFGRLCDTTRDIRHTSKFDFKMPEKSPPASKLWVGSPNPPVHVWRTCRKPLKKFTRPLLKNARMLKTLPMNPALMTTCEIWPRCQIRLMVDNALTTQRPEPFILLLTTNKTWIRNLTRMALSLMKQTFLMMLSYSPFQMFWPTCKQLQLKLRKGLMHRKSGENLTKGTPGEVNVVSMQIKEQLLLQESKLSSVHGWQQHRRDQWTATRQKPYLNV